MRENDTFENDFYNITLRKSHVHNKITHKLRFCNNISIGLCLKSLYNFTVHINYLFEYTYYNSYTLLSKFCVKKTQEYKKTKGIEIQCIFVVGIVLNIDARGARGFLKTDPLLRSVKGLSSENYSILSQESKGFLASGFFLYKC